MFFEKNVLCENYSNLRRHLSLRSDSTESHGKNNEAKSYVNNTECVSRFLLPCEF